MTISRKLTAILVMATAASTMAAPLTPEQALAAAIGNNNDGIDRRMRSKAATMQLAYTVDGSAAPTVYVFTPQDEDAAGFVVVSADDVAQPLLGYSYETHFDAATIPPQMKWWLDACGATVEAIAENPDKAAAYNLGREEAIGTDGVRRLPAKAPKAAISPLCSTQWNQGAPFNNDCPMVGGQRSVTGCVATAMAQVMKHHNWPQKGTGSHTYTFSANGTAYQETFDFEATTFGWSNMRNSYNGSYTSTQASAVAKLMHACGVAADMSYSPEGSGALEYIAASGMIDYLGYDAGMCIQQREWYLASEWDDLIYGELASSRPVMYCGNDKENGHAFVCDGYDGNGYYHINWGWGGVSDGYFLLADLNPYNQGIGGGTGENGFNWGQTAMVGAQPAQAGSERPMIMAGTSLSTNSLSYAVSRNTNINVCTDYGFFNYSTCALENFYLGFGLVADGVSKFAGSCYVDQLDVFSGFKSYPIPTTDMPEGTWKAYPALSKDGVNWTPIKFDPTLTGGYLDVTVTAAKITVSETTGTPDTTGSTSLSVKFTGSDIDGPCYTGNTYKMSYSFSTDGAFSMPFYLILVNESSYSVAAEGESKTITLTDAGTVNADFSITIPRDINTDVRYSLALCVIEDDMYRIIDSQSITVKTRTWATYVDISLSHIDPEGTTEFYLDKFYKFYFDFTTDGAFSTDYYLVLVNKTDWVVAANGESKNVSAAMAGTVTENFYLSIPADLDLDKAYEIALCTLTDDNMLSIEYAYDITIKSLEPKVEFSVVSFTPYDDSFYTGTTYDFTFAMESNVAQEQTYYALLVDYGESLVLKSESDAMHAVWDTPGEITRTCSLYIPEGLDVSRKYVLFIATLNDTTYTPITGWYINLAERSGIEGIGLDEMPCKYYDLQGRPVANPRPGTLYIEHSLSGSRKIIYN